MANTFPYAASAGPLVNTIQQLRKSFPQTVNAETLQKLGLAPKNESYVLNVFRFLGLLDEEGKKRPEAAKVFLKQDDEFASGFEKLVQAAYKQLFELHPDAWAVDKPKLVSFFRTSDDSTETVGARQAGTFMALASLAGHRELPKTSSNGSKLNTPKPSRSAKKNTPANTGITNTSGSNGESSALGLSVRVEINLPASNDQEVYDKIFRSIRENLINAK